MQGCSSELPLYRNLGTPVYGALVRYVQTYLLCNYPITSRQLEAYIHLESNNMDVQDNDGLTGCINMAESGSNSHNIKSILEVYFILSE